MTVVAVRQPGSLSSPPTRGWGFPAPHYKDKIELANLLKNHPYFDFRALLNSAYGHNKCSLALALKDLPQFDIPVALALMPTDTCKFKLAEGLKDQPGAEGLMEYVKKFRPQGIDGLRDWPAFNTQAKGPDASGPKTPDDLLLAQVVAPR